MIRSPQTLDDIRRIARKKFGYDDLRPAQEEVIKLILAGHDTLSVMPTGSGKSAIYQLAALAINGPTVVVSPLIALQKDQVDSLKETGVADAAIINSTVKASAKREAFEKLEDGDLEFLFLAPEQFANPETLEKLRASPPSLFVIDEAHCVTEWGHDFRPDYARLDSVINALGRPRVLALTATASPQARQDIIERLGLKSPKVVVWGFDRPNIFLEVEKCPDEETKKRLLVERVRSFDKPGIVYVATRGHAEELTELLGTGNIRAEFYHGGMRPDDRKRVQEAFMADDRGLIVATNAFGMGVDKPDVRFVLHYDIPDSVDAYYQEVGRAGRDGKPSRALLLYYAPDVGRRRAQASSGKLAEDAVEEVVAALLEAKKPVDPAEIAEGSDMSVTKLDQTINRLQQTGAVEILPTGEVVASDRGADAGVLAERVVEEQDKFRAQRIGRVEIMRDYAEGDTCRRHYLLNYFGEAFPNTCDQCDNCQSGLSSTDRAADRQSGRPFQEKSRVTHAKLGPGTVMRYEADKVVVLFDDHGYKSLVTQFVLDNELLRSA